MTQPRLEPGGQAGSFSLHGELTFATVPALLTESDALLAGATELCIDLAGVQRADSAGLALLAEWLRLASGRQQAITYINAPTQLHNLAKVSGLEQVLSFERGESGGR